MAEWLEDSGGDNDWNSGFSSTVDSNCTAVDKLLNLLATWYACL